MYARDVPKLWNKTIETHRREVRDAILDSTATLANEHGPLSVTMSQIAEETGVGRATLYKYFSDVESILVAWHERQVTQHLAELEGIGNPEEDVGQRLRAVLEGYAFLRYQHHGSELAGLVHRGDHLNQAHDQLTGFVRDLLAEAAAAGQVRADIAPEELASYCLHAITAAGGLKSKASVQRLVQVIMAGIGPEATAVAAVPRARRRRGAT
jgi:AcrR family transcriptional regulator